MTPPVPRWLVATLVSPAGGLFAVVVCLCIPYLEVDGWGYLSALLLGTATWWLAVWCLLWVLGGVIRRTRTSLRIDRWLAAWAAEQPDRPLNLDELRHHIGGRR